ncbi:MAG: hypothetical protein ABI718_13165 [Acidobacteriota bacterium]
MTLSRPSRVAGAILLMFSLVLVLSSCNESAPPPPSPVVPRVAATLLTVRTIIPGEKGLIHLVIVSDSKVRFGNESGRWRLLDLRKRSVTFVDETAKTYVSRSLNDLIREKEESFERDMPDSIPTARITETERRTIAGRDCRNYQVTMGKYVRDICLSVNSVVGDGFFPLYVASEQNDNPYAGAMRAVFRKLITLEGFPVLDRGELASGQAPLLIEKVLVKSETKQVPVEWVTVPAGFRNLGEPENATSPGGGHRPALSAPRDRKAPAAE